MQQHFFLPGNLPHLEGITQRERDQWTRTLDQWREVVMRNTTRDERLRICRWIHQSTFGQDDTRIMSPNEEPSIVKEITSARQAMSLMILIDLMAFLVEHDPIKKTFFDRLPQLGIPRIPFAHPSSSPNMVNSSEGDTFYTYETRQYLDLYGLYKAVNSPQCAGYLETVLLNKWKVCTS